MISRIYFFKISILMILICTFSNLFAQYGNGALGTLNVSSNTSLTLTATNVTARNSNVLTLTSTAGFAASDEILIIQMTGNNGNEGNWEQIRVTSVLSSTTLSLAIVPTKTYDFATQKVQIIKLPQYFNASISSTLTAPAWNGSTGGVLAFMVKNNFTISGGNLDMSGKGFTGTSGTALGTGGAGGTGGIHGDPATAGGNSGAGGDGIFGGKNGGSSGGVAAPVASPLNPNVPGAGIPATNASNKPSKRYLLGAGGTGGEGGIGGIGAGGGGGGSDQPSTSVLGTNGVAGGIGGSGGTGGSGGVGGGLILVFANNFIAGSGVQFKVNGSAGTVASSGTNGGTGGAGGTGGGRECNLKGGGGGGGNGAGGGTGGNGGNGGAAGFVYMKKASGSSLTATMINLSGGAAGAGGTKGTGGLGGANGSDANPSCLVCGPTTTLGMSSGCGTAGLLLAGLNFIDGTANSTYSLGGYKIWSTVPNVGVGLVQIGTSLTDCQGTPYYKVQMGQNFNPAASFGSGTPYYLVSSTATSTATLEAYLSSFFSNPASATGVFNDISINDGTHIWVQECYAGICGARAASQPGPDGADGASGVASGNGDFDSESVAAPPLPIKLLFFVGKKETNQVRLDWKTELESNFTGFEIQKSIDGIRFEKIDFLQAKGINSNGASYTLLDKNNLQNENIYYRLNQIDRDGTSEFSNTIVIRNSNNNTLESITMSPVPTTNVLNIRYNSSNSENLKYRITNALGEIIQEELHYGQIGENYIVLPVLELPNGIYYIRFSTENESDGIVKMFVKE